MIPGRDIAIKTFSKWRPTAERHLEFSKFGILVMCPVLERDSALSYKISHLSDNHSLRYKQKMIFKMAAGRHFEFTQFWYFVKQLIF